MQEPISTPPATENDFGSYSSDLKYRRQFVATFEQSDRFYHWQHCEFSDEGLHIYAHPDLELSSASAVDEKTKLMLLGFAIDPGHPDRTNQEIVKALIDARPVSVEAFSSSILDLAGRFVIFLGLSNQIYVFHDPGGLRSVYYANANGHVYVASQPFLFSEFFHLRSSDRFSVFNSSSYRLRSLEYWLPCGLTLYEDMYQLMPNHYLDMKRGEQKRYWPDQPIITSRIRDMPQQPANMIEEVLLSANSHYGLALSMTAGWDSRVLLAASKNIVNDLFVFTLLLENLTERSPDIYIPRSMLNAIGIDHHIYDCKSCIDDDFYELYKASVDLAHDSMANATCTLYKMLPKERLWLKGNGLEIARCFYYKYGVHDDIVSPSQLAALEPGWEKIPFVVEYLEEWLRDTKRVCNSFNIDILDLFYWEHRVGSWLAQGWLEKDIAVESFTPYLCRPLLITLLRMPTKYRSAPDYLLYRDMINILWPELLKWPINPNSLGIGKAVELNLRKLLKDFGMYSLVRKSLKGVKRIIDSKLN